MWTLAIAGHWRFESGDPTFLGWATTAGYAIAALLCLRAGSITRCNPALRGSGATPWWWLTAWSMGLGINKQLDLQTLMIDLGRAASTSEGWYGYRREVQTAFFIGLTVVGAMGTWVVVHRHRAFIRGNRGLIAGLGFVLLYALLRAADINHVDLLPQSPVVIEDWLWIIEVFGLGLMIRGAVRGLNSLPADRTSR